MGGYGTDTGMYTTANPEIMAAVTESFGWGLLCGIALGGVVVMLVWRPWRRARATNQQS